MKLIYCKIMLTFADDIDIIGKINNLDKITVWEGGKSSKNVALKINEYKTKYILNFRSKK